MAKPAATRTLHVGRVMAAILILVPTNPALRASANAYLASSSAALYPRHHYGTDGSDQVSFQVSLAAFVARAVPGPRVQDSALWYVALQSGLSYLISGGVKLFGPSWRSGQAVPGVMRTATYGSRPLWKIFRDRPRLAAFSAHTMLMGEGLFAAVFLAGGRTTRPFVVGAALFHVAVGASMGLGRFVTAFGSMLPAVAYVTNRRPKERILPRMALGGAALVLGGGFFAAIARRRRVLRRSQSTTSLMVEGGGEIALKISGRSQPGTPILILEHGMLSTPEHFAWIEETVGEVATLVTYSRRGYGSSTNALDRGRRDISPDELLAVIDYLSTRRGSLVIGGHSLGGYIARLAAEERPTEVDGVVYIDSSHPAQFERSDKQRAGAAHLAVALAGIPESLRLGLGWLLTEPPWLLGLPPRVRRSIFDQYRDGRLWKAGRLEWRRSIEHFARAENHGLERLEVPALVVTAERTVRSDHVQNDLNRALAEGHAVATEVCVRFATHDSILTSERHAKAAAYAICDFLGSVSRIS